jgi:uncharacterized integral membrane protein
MNTKQIILIVIAVLALIFIIQNTATVTVAFLFFEIAMPRAILLSFTILIGIIIGILLPYKIGKQK